MMSEILIVKRDREGWMMWRKARGQPKMTKGINITHDRRGFEGIYLFRVSGDHSHF